MGFYSEKIVPKVTHFLLNQKPIREVRAKAVSEAHGIVLDVGFGSGLNLPHYSSSVSKVLAIEPSEVARKMARPLIAKSSFPVEFSGLDGQRLSLGNESVDCIVTTWTLCTIPDPALALEEFRRVLKKEGKYFFIEHGLSPDEKIMRWQNRFDRLQSFLAGGCHLNRPIETLVASSLEISSLKKFYFEGPKTHSFFYSGSAQKR